MECTGGILQGPSTPREALRGGLGAYRGGRACRDSEPLLNRPPGEFGAELNGIGSTLVESPAVARHRTPLRSEGH